jgi:hypothetical protein
MFSKIVQLWNNHGFEILLGLSLSFILLFALVRIGKKGSWSKSYYAPNKGQWPSYKSKRRIPRQSKGELECRRVLQKIFKKPFNTSRPDFLRNPVTGGNFNLELDCFDSHIGLACEYNGKQHYKYCPYFHRNKEHFLNQKYRDDMKRRICRDNNIRLIEVPYTVPHEQIEGFIRKKLVQMGFVNI